MRGSALMEVMVAMFVLAVGILGAGAMQTIGLQANRGAYLRSQAIYLASDMMDRIRENRTARATYVGVNTTSATVKALTKPSCTSDYAGCSATDIATADIIAWAEKFNTQKVLPEGSSGDITGLSSGDNIRITITWKENEWKAGGGREEISKTYMLVSAIKKEVL